MAIDKNKKYDLLNQAITITQKAAVGGGLKHSGSIVDTLADTYSKLVELVEGIEKGD